MDFVLEVVAFIKTVFVNKVVNKYSEEFANKTMSWLKSVFSSKDPKLARDLEDNPNEADVQTKLAINVHELLKDPAFEKAIRSYMEQSLQHVVLENSISDNKVKSEQDALAEIDNTASKSGTSKNEIKNNDLTSGRDTVLRIKN